ncbi:hypothetical protein PL85_04270 [Vibrio anguillarum]|uniref:hypothetical protein n=1 Tax=Vibrio TaxID=662 RepID=UPI0002482CB1|nr:MULTISPECIES: hypothetical protein [Vibrio]MBF4281273.1 hypothetical protein [Vibrio anguillarum]MBF4288621.1 hypothetical protein [Vibrio anguillarum]MBF4340129.1 hypothetical protein [Vibrio anguillarum]MBF4357935.1 hypothetical protein [Vibrio anguillarum]MBF4377715.1 hypothetical protein [Vibrio anguillarum]
MNCKIALSIAMTSAIALHSGMSFAETSTEAPVSAQPTSQNGGKCAAGKCGTEKRFEKQDLKSDPQGRLVRARDGKCGLTAEGITPSAETITLTNSKITGGVCGQ